MWVMRLAHPTVNKFRIIAEHTREAAEQKATDHLRAWEAQFSEGVATALAVSRGEKRWLNPSAAKQLFSPQQRQKQLAEHLTAQVQEEFQMLEHLLRRGLSLTYRITWGPRDRSPYPVPAPTAPREEVVPPEPLRDYFARRPTFTDYLLPQIRKRKKAEAEDRFRAAHSEWERSRSEIETRYREELERHPRKLAEWDEKKQAWLGEQALRNAVIDEQEAAYHCLEPKAVAAYCRLLLNASIYPDIAAAVPGIATREHFASPGAVTEHPDTFPKTFELEYVAEARTVVIDYELPPKEAMPSIKGYRHVATSDRVIPVPAARSSVEKTYESALYQAALRTIFELLEWDEAHALDSVGFNGWVTSIDKATGQTVHACVLTVQASRKEFLEINLAEVDPKACFRKLKGISAAKLAGLSPVRPVLRINREDKRFIAPRPAVDVIDGSTNLAAMDWEDFEQLIRDVFESEFSNDGGEVKITRASRDRGVDAVAFDPDPIRGGKIVIQAKRYTDTVSVSAVRDLYGTILNEGANKGILVTTADYGPDAYDFAKGKPITLLNGSELLYLLRKHGHNARIDLAEARQLAADQDKDRLG